MSLQTVLEQIKTLRPVAEENVESGPIETLSGRRGRKNQAVEQLKTLTQEYTRDLMTSALFIVVSGANRDGFAAASEQFGCFVTDPEEFYKDLADRVSPSLYLNKTSVGNIFDVLGRHLEDKMLELNVREYPQLIFRQEYAKLLSSKEEFTDLIKTAINQQIGAEIVGIQSVNSLTLTAIEKNHGEKITPVVLSTGDEQLALNLVKDLERLTTRVFLVVAGKSSKIMKNTDGVVVLKETTEESVGQAMKTIRNNLKK